jgi:type I restriction enzyme S subunit
MPEYCGMEVKPGYKQTEVGVIPKDWEMKRLGDVLKVRHGKSQHGIIAQDGMYSVLASGGEIGRTNACIYDQPSVLIGRKGTIDSPQYVESPFWTVDTLFYTEIFRGGHPKFMFYKFNMIHWRKYNEASGVPSLNAKTIENIKVTLPPFPEQRAIAEALSDVDGLLSGLDRLIAKKRDLKQATMQQLLTGQTRLPGFHGEWEVKRLGDVGKFIKGSGVTKDQTRTGSLACVRYGELYTHHNDVIRGFYSWISPTVAKTAVQLEHGDILFAGSGETKEEIGKCAAFVSEIKAFAGGDIVILRPAHSNSEFLGYYLNTSPISRQKASRGQGDAVVHISSAGLADVLCTLPPRLEQTAIASVLTAMDEELAGLERHRAKTAAVKQGMMQELLSGRIRLVQPEVLHA